MYIVGDAEEAEELAKRCLLNVKEICAATKELRSELSRLQESFQDNGVKEVEEVVFKVYAEIQTHVDDVVEISNILKQYADVLRKQ